MYVIKFVDKKRNEWTYFIEGCLLSLGQRNFFLKSHCFKSKNKAKSHIRKIIHCRRPWLHYKYSNFEIIQVVPAPIYEIFQQLLKRGQDYFMVVKGEEK